MVIPDFIVINKIGLAILTDVDGSELKINLISRILRKTIRYNHYKDVIDKYMSFKLKCCTSLN